MSTKDLKLTTSLLVTAIRSDGSKDQYPAASHKEADILVSALIKSDNIKEVQFTSITKKA